LPAAFEEVADGVLTGVLSRPHEEVGEIKGGVETDGESQPASAAQLLPEG